MDNTRQEMMSRISEIKACGGLYSHRKCWSAVNPLLKPYVQLKTRHKKIIKNIQTLLCYKTIHFRKLLVTSPTPEGHRDVLLTEGGGGSGGCQRRLIPGLLGTRMMKGVRACTAGALPWLSPGPLPHPQPKIPAADSRCCNNPHCPHPPTTKVLSLLPCEALHPC